MAPCANVVDIQSALNRVQPYKSPPVRTCTLTDIANKSTTDLSHFLVHFGPRSPPHFPEPTQLPTPPHILAAYPALFPPLFTAGSVPDAIPHWEAYFPGQHWPLDQLQVAGAGFTIKDGRYYSARDSVVSRCNDPLPNLPFSTPKSMPCC